MDGVEVNGPHLVKHFVDDRTNAAGPGLQTGHGVVGDVEAITHIDGRLKLGVVAPNSVRVARIFLLAFGGVQDHEAVDGSVVVQVVITPINRGSYAQYGFFCQTHR